VIAAARCIPGVCGVFVSSASPGTTRTPSVRQSGPTGPILAPTAGPDHPAAELSPVIPESASELRKGL
jgi:hypothetical protein